MNAPHHPKARLPVQSKNQEHQHLLIHLRESQLGDVLDVISIMDLQELDWMISSGSQDNSQLLLIYFLRREIKS